jgi:hypothetical protein
MATQLTGPLFCSTLYQSLPTRRFPISIYTPLPFTHSSTALPGRSPHPLYNHRLPVSRRPRPTTTTTTTLVDRTVYIFFAHPRTRRCSAAAHILAQSIRTSISKFGSLCDLALTYKAASTPVNNMIFTESESNNMGRGAYDTTGTPKPQPPPPK